MTALPTRWTAACIACPGLVSTLLTLITLALAAAGCSPEIGDSCASSFNCSAQSSRSCDRTQPDGYCTISPCERGTCPEEATCVKFRPGKERLATTYCMRKCSEASDCRDGEGYRCTTAEDFATCAEAETLDGPAQRFCAAPATLPTLPVADGGLSNDAACMGTPN
jgi:hypothetical protein